MTDESPRDLPPDWPATAIAEVATLNAHGAISWIVHNRWRLGKLELSDRPAWMKIREALADHLGDFRRVQA